MQFIHVMKRLNFQQPLLQSSVSHDPSEIIVMCLHDTDFSTLKETALNHLTRS